MKKILISLTISASTLFYGCGVAPKQSAHSDLAAASETATVVASEDTTEVYRGTEKGGTCELLILKNAENKVEEMTYFSSECEGAGSKGCELTVEGLFSSFSRAPSLQFPGYTRLALSHGVSPIVIPVFGFLAWDEFIVAKDDMSSVKAVSRANINGVQSVSWTSECSDVKLVP